MTPSRMRGRGARTPIGASENFDTFVLLLKYHLGQDEPLQSKLFSPASDVFHRKVASLLSSVGLWGGKHFLLGCMITFILENVENLSPSVGPSLTPPPHFMGGRSQRNKIISLV